MIYIQKYWSSADINDSHVLLQAHPIVSTHLIVTCIIYAWHNPWKSIEAAIIAINNVRDDSSAQITVFAILVWINFSLGIRDVEGIVRLELLTVLKLTVLIYRITLWIWNVK